MLKVYTNIYCPDWIMARKFLDSTGVEYTMTDVDVDHDGESLITALNGGKRVVPTFELDGVYYFNPTLLELANLLSIDK